MNGLPRPAQAGRQRVILILRIDHARLDIPQAIDAFVAVKHDAALMEAGAFGAGQGKWHQ
jgi:hypothetical protein